jgi:hypothetical protein
VPRTEAQREQRRAREERSKNGLRGVVTELVAQALYEARPELRDERRDIALAFAYIAEISLTKPRQHGDHRGWFSMNCIELDDRFGRAHFHRLNQRFDIVEVKKKHGYGSTRAYRLRPDIQAAIDARMDALIDDPSATTRLIASDGRYLRRATPWSLARNLQSLARELLGTASPQRLVRVNMDSLLVLRQELRLIDACDETRRARRLRRLEMDDATDVGYVRRALDDLIRKAKIDFLGYGNVLHDYVMCKTGRLFAEGTSLQSVPKLIKRFALHDAYEYDFSNCHYTILLQLAKRAGVECPTILEYLGNKRQIRTMLACDVGVSEEQAKECLIALLYGATKSPRLQDAIPQAIGIDRAKQLYAHPFFAALSAELSSVRSAILERCPTYAARTKNALRLLCEPDATPAQRLAHVLQGIEAQALLAVLREFDAEIITLEHDGFTTRSQIDLNRAQAIACEGTGFELRLEETLIQVPTAFIPAIRVAA